MAEIGLKSGRRGRCIIGALTLVQFALLAYLLAYFTFFPNESKIDLEAGVPIQNTDNLAFSKAELLDTVSILSGSQFTGRCESNPLSFNINYSAHNMMWFLLDRPGNSKAPVLDWPKKYRHVKDKVWQEFSHNIQDGVVNFIYDTGSNASMRDSWSGFVVETLNRSSFMPWQKRLDFVAISTLNRDNGFNFINSLNSNTIFLCPNITPYKFTEITSLEIAKNVQVITVPPGIYPLFEDVWTLVVPVDRDKFSLDFLVRRHDGELTLFCGSGYGDFADRFSLIHNLLNEMPSLIVGNFNESYLKWNDSDIKYMKQLVAKYPHLKIEACGGVGFSEYEFWRSIFGDNVYCGSLGERISL